MIKSTSTLTLQKVRTEDFQDSYSVSCVAKKDLRVAKYFAERGSKGEEKWLVFKVI